MSWCYVTPTPAKWWHFYPFEICQKQLDKFSEFTNNYFDMYNFENIKFPSFTITNTMAPVLCEDNADCCSCFHHNCYYFVPQRCSL